MNRFKPGQEVVCVDDSSMATGHPCPIKKNTLCIVAGYATDLAGTWLTIEGVYVPFFEKELVKFRESRFAPVADIREIIEVLERQPEEV